MKKIKHPIAKSIAVIAIGAFILIGADTSPDIVKYTIKTDKQSADVRFAFLSDVHDSLYGDGQSEILDAIEKNNCDFVIFGGDLFDGRMGDECLNSLLLVEKLCEKYKCFYTIGNHEVRRGDSEELKRLMREAGVTVLEGESAEFKTDNSQIEISGIYSPYEYSETENGPVNQLEQVKGTSDKFRILIEHFPEDIENLTECGFDLVLSGHAHGGQWRIPFTSIAAYAPGQGLFPQNTGGMSYHKDTIQIVSRGLALPRFFSVPRLYNRPEITIVEIKSNMENNQ